MEKISVLLISVPLMIVAIVCTLFADRIDTAKPRLLQKNETKEIGAFYALTEECESIFPVRADGFLNLSELKVTEGFVQFVLYSEQRVLAGVYVLLYVAAWCVIGGMKRSTGQI